jgi:hypothetical protein
MHLIRSVREALNLTQKQLPQRLPEGILWD